MEIIAENQCVGGELVHIMKTVTQPYSAEICLPIQPIVTRLDDKFLRTELKQQGVDSRRLSRFSQLALLGALPLASYLTPQSAVYLGSVFSSPSKFYKMYHNLMQHNLPSPLDFMANLHNAANFHIAQALNLQGQSLFLALEKSDIHQLFELAELDLTAGQTALIGWVLESPNDEITDESCWWVVRGT